MISIVETTSLAASTARVWRFFSDEVADRYPDWHPEHLRWRWLRGRPLAPGSVWFAEEWIDRLHIAGRFIVDAAEPERFFSYRLAFPATLVGAIGSFRLEPDAGGGSRLVQEVRLGHRVPVVDPAIRAVLPIRELRRHMREEQANLPDLLA